MVDTMLWHRLRNAKVSYQSYVIEILIIWHRDDDHSYKVRSIIIPYHKRHFILPNTSSSQLESSKSSFCKSNICDLYVWLWTRVILTYELPMRLYLSRSISIAVVSNAEERQYAYALSRETLIYNAVTLMCPTIENDLFTVWLKRLLGQTMIHVLWRMFNVSIWKHLTKVEM